MFYTKELYIHLWKCSLEIYVVFTAHLSPICFLYLVSLGFTVQMAQDYITGFEGDTLRAMVRLEGQLIGEVDVQLHLLTVPEFQSSPVAPPGFNVTDAAECTYRHT